jgi:hypothetical protein
MPTTTTVTLPGGERLSMADQHGAVAAAPVAAEHGGGDNDEDSLFFSFTPCHFKPAAATAFACTPGCLAYTTDPEELSRLKPLAVALKPDGVAPDDPRATLWRVSNTAARSTDKSARTTDQNTPARSARAQR